MSETSPEKLKPENKPQTAVPFVTFDERSKKFIINLEAKKILSNPNNKQIGILSLVGKYRTGKSFLLNRVLIDKKSSKGFDVGPTIKPCTKGIWLWSSPLMISNNYSNNSFPAYLIDTEGLGAYDEEINHDSKIFLISILISSLFIYNSFGTIDEVALNNLSFILNLSKSLKLRNNSNNLYSKESEEKEMAKYFPSLLWLLRDFALKLEDSDGNVITAKQYLENALMEQKGSTQSIEEKNLVRKMIKTYFLERDCFPLVRPVENENDLQNLMTLPDEKIRPEFIKQSAMLRNKIYMKIKPKNFNGKILSGQMLINLLESIINAINEGAIPVIENSWNYIENNEYLKCIKENTEYFKKLILSFQKENITHPDFFSELQNYCQTITEEIISKFKDENSKRFDNIEEYVHKLKLSLNQQFKQLNEENISLLKDKYIFDLEKEINILFEDKEKLLKENHINFISSLMQIKYKLDAAIPFFSLKEQISYDKIIDAIKKYIEECFVKPRNSFEQQIQNLKIEYQYLDDKFKNVNEEYNKDKLEFKQTVNNYNDMLIESKLRIKTSEEKIKNFEAEKKTIKETNEREIISNNKSYEEKLEKLTMEINKLKSDVKAREEDLLIYKLNIEKESALTLQKITFLEKEVEQWKERYNTQNKELSENKSDVINLNSEIDKLKSENKSLKNKLSVSGNLTINDNYRGANNNFFATGTVGGVAAASNKILIELLSGQNAIKDSIKEIMEKTSEFIEKNKNNNCNNRNTTKNYVNEINNNNNIENKNIKKTFSLTANQKINNDINLNNENMINNITNNKPHLKQKSSSSSKSKIMKNDDEIKNQNLNIRVSNTILKKDITGKPFLDYICEINNGNEKYKLNKKFGHFIMLHKSLKSLFKDLVKLPDGGNLFTNISDIKQTSFHESKLEQLDKYVSELLQIDVVKKSTPFRIFFELDETHEQNNSGQKKGRISVEKQKNINKNPSNNDIGKKNITDFTNELLNFK